ncbi:hypothetical protein GCM10012319_32110 [Comamonas sp. KCTC 72670]|nr:hypothetical protein GCM10012319_32110 [Comamonas sp. KCTC 72670]
MSPAEVTTADREARFILAPDRLGAVSDASATRVARWALSLAAQPQRMQRLEEFASAFLDQIMADVARVQAHAKGGMRPTTLTGDFANAPPSILERLRWWAACAQEALGQTDGTALAERRSTLLEHVATLEREKALLQHERESEEARADDEQRRGDAEESRADTAEARVRELENALGLERSAVDSLFHAVRAKREGDAMETVLRSVERVVSLRVASQPPPAPAQGESQAVTDVRAALEACPCESVKPCAPCCALLNYLDEMAVPQRKTAHTPPPGLLEGTDDRGQAEAGAGRAQGEDEAQREGADVPEVQAQGRGDAAPTRPVDSGAPVPVVRLGGSRGDVTPPGLREAVETALGRDALDNARVVEGALKRRHDLAQQRERAANELGLTRMRAHHAGARDMAEAIAKDLGINVGRPPSGPIATPDLWPTLTAFTLEMRNLLDHHRPAKGGREGWVRDAPAALLRRVREEADEVEQGLGERLAPEVVSRRCVDVALMSMMTADAYAHQHARMTPPPTVAPLLPAGEVDRG